MNKDIVFRRAREKDADALAELVAIASDGVVLIEWTRRSQQEMGVMPLDIGARIYAQAEGDHSYRNVIVAELGKDIIGMILAFPMSERDAKPKSPPFDQLDVFAPYHYLEAPNTWHISGMSVIPEHRRQGIGNRLLQMSKLQARELGFEQMSLVVFEQNARAMKLYKKFGFEIADRAPVVPHPLIPYTGDALLMVTKV